MLLKSFRTNMSLALLLLASIINFSTIEAAAATTVPARCSYAYIAATERMAELVAAQVNTTNARKEISLAQSAVQLAKDLDCPLKPMLTSIDCVVASIKNTGGQLPDKLTMLRCVETAIGQTFPKLKQ